jgi:D-alanyl-D-alanine carboxypeptidase/D-alanyl-D-alanine-endopeptidase (penicillin-binding protein 4)
VLLSDTLKAAGVDVAGGAASPTASGAPQTAGLVAENRIGELVSAPLSEDVKVTLKTSQNLHAMMMPYIVGSVRGHGDGSVIRRGFRVERNFLANAGLDIDGAAQWDGEGGGMFTPDFMVRYLAYMARQPTFKVFKASLPVLGQDGTLHDAGKAAKGAVFAKTGTFGARDFVNNRIFLTAKGLAGYTTTPSGELVAIAVYVANVPVESTLDDMPAALNAITKVAGNPIADISAAIHLLPITSPQ